MANDNGRHKPTIGEPVGADIDGPGFNEVQLLEC